MLEMRMMVGLFVLGIAAGGLMQKGFSILSFGWTEMTICSLVVLGLVLLCPGRK